MKRLVEIFFLIAFVSMISSYPTNDDENPDYWMKLGLSEIKEAERVHSERNTGKAKNIILFLGDGMSLPTISATRIYKTQLKGSLRGGEEGFLSFEKFPHIGLSKIYSVDAQSPDSASTAFAMLSGVKTNYYCVGLDNSCVREDLNSHVNITARVPTIMSWAQDAGKSTGFVTTSRVSHASPSALYAHSAFRKWECDQFMPEGSDALGAKDITWQMAKNFPGKGARVILGGGRTTWRPKQPNINYDYECWRSDGEDLIKSWMNKSNVPSFDGLLGAYVENRDQLLNLNLNSTDYILGLFSESHMGFEPENNMVRKKEPSISEMTSAAIEVLSKNSKGFFLMVEGANIDKAHHKGQANQALLETSALDDAIEKALNMTNEKDTLIIVTADHGHNMNFGSYETRGADVRGPSDTMKGNDGKTLPILSYGGSPGFFDHYFVSDATHKIERKEMSDMDYKNAKFRHPSAVQTFEAPHSAADVAIYARGPFSHFIHSVHEQSYIAHVMSYGACIGPHEERCSKSNTAALSATPILCLVLLSIFYVMESQCFK